MTYPLKYNFLISLTTSCFLNFVAQTPDGFDGGCFWTSMFSQLLSKSMNMNIQGIGVIHIVFLPDLFIEVCLRKPALDCWLKAIEVQKDLTVKSSATSPTWTSWLPWFIRKFQDWRLLSHLHDEGDARYCGHAKPAHEGLKEAWQ